MNKTALTAILSFVFIVAIEFGDQFCASPAAPAIKRHPTQSSEHWIWGVPRKIEAIDLSASLRVTLHRFLGRGQSDAQIRVLKPPVMG